MSLSACVVVGNPRAGSTTRAAAEHFVQALCRDRVSAPDIIDLADYAHVLLDGNSVAVNNLATTAASSDVLVLATPTYKATYTAVLKAFLDRLPPGALSGVGVVPLHTGGGEQHALAVRSGLVPLVMELGGAVIGTGVHLVVRDGSWDREEVEARAIECRAGLATLARVANRLGV